MYAIHPKQKQIIQLLEDEFICPENGLDQIYSQIEQYADNQKLNSIQNGVAENLKSPFSQIYQDFSASITTMAIDLPVFLSNNSKNKKTIMVCAMDSLPPLPTNPFWDNHQIDFKKDIGFWAPFSVIDDWKNPTGSMRTNIPFFETLLAEYNIYITDIYKLFFRVEKENVWVNSNSIGSYTNLCDQKGVHIHGKILAQEIEIIQPEAIITLGNASRNTLLQINANMGFNAQNPFGWKDDLQAYLWADKIKIIASTHISGAANGAKSAILKNSQYAHIEGKYQNERLAKIILQKLNDE
jgi:hypothetical protein